MNKIKPQAIKKGDTIALISPASLPRDLTRIDKATLYFENKGYKVKIGKNTTKLYGYLAGKDSERLSDLNDAFSDNSVKAIICLRGGYGAGRLINLINFDLIKDNPKIFTGYSDITTLQMAFLSRTGMISFAGPMAAVDLYENPDPYTENLFWDIITGSKEITEVPLPEGVTLNGNGQGSSSGELIGGNLALFTSLLGSPYLPKPEGKILFFEDVSEPPYRIDRMLNSLLLSGYFEKCNGVIIGQFTDGESNNPYNPTLSQEEVFSHYLSKIKCPVITNFPHGHVKNIATLPFGLEVTIDSNNCKVLFNERAVTI